ncbi:MAG TPA: C-terminal binding protein [Acidimicrobiales bacterium]|nr:C-terminal binding protein [Acidimicrobiales bacterium]
MGYRVVLTDQVFPSVDTERELLATIDATLEVASGERAQILQAAAGADAILTTYYPLDRAFIEGLERCRVIARYGIGVDNIDLAAAAERGIVVTNVPDYCIEEVGAHTVALVLALLRRVPAGAAIVAAGGWGIEGVRPIRRLSTLVLGLVGTGRIGRWVAGALGPLVAEVLAYDPFLSEPPPGTRLVELDELLARSDVVSLHCPLTEATRGLIGTDELARMKRSAVLVNTSRGPLVQFGALRAALEAGEIAGAALDVFETEPPTLPSPAVPNLLATPHMAFYSEEALAESQVKAATQVVKVLSGEPPDYPVR